MKTRLFDSETMVSRAATEGPGSSTEVVVLSAVTVVSSGTGGGTSCELISNGPAIECSKRLGRNSRTSAQARAQAPRREIRQQIGRHRAIMVGVTQGGAPIDRGRDTQIGRASCR